MAPARSLLMTWWSVSTVAASVHQMRSGLGAFADAQPVDVESGVVGGQCRANVRMHVGVFGPIPIIMIVGRAMHEKLNRARRPTLRDA